VNTEEFISEFEDLDTFISKIGDSVPERMHAQVQAYKSRMGTVK
jgi:GTP-dependent phosphoenolpyruvate carboxykinase